MSNSANAQAAERMRLLYEAGDMGAIERAALDYWNDETVDDFPQSGEVFQGRAAAAAFAAAYEAATATKLSYTLREVRGRDDLWVIEGTIDYGNGETACAVTIVELKDGMIHRQTDYFASPFPAPDWRAPFRKQPA